MKALRSAVHLRVRPAQALPALCLLLGLGISLPCRAAIDENLPDAPTLARLELQAHQAAPREQCFLYTALVHTFTELAGKQIRAGDMDAANASLRKVEEYAELIHLGLAEDPKRIKNAEQLMQHTAHRLHEYLHFAAAEDQAEIKGTVAHLDRLEDEILAQVFKH